MVGNNEVILCNTLGQEILKSGTWPIDVSQLPSGVYMLNYGVGKLQKVIKE
jgi:hypothetical protein